MKEITLTQGHVALVDDEDYETASAFKWSASIKRGRVYAKRTFRKPDGRESTQYMHQLLVPGEEQVDHKDGDGRNNQRHNLRPATNQQNAQSFQRKELGASSIFRGVSWDASRGQWKSYIKVAGKHLFVGRFTSESDAARAYDEAARTHYGDRAAPNFP